ncbi:PREDICTED: uncharacterized protein LOC104827706 [Tarenaya hassleriana]|uniref:uncharacterized protein LOC104827706 n=1 Tax=Tarenaya hassleriana TaxID=28532 RepID=UPI00053C3009|nr:PREDICTED: uncharacterized protein LOC104827706 [Tarenaya hassleriana]
MVNSKVILISVLLIASFSSLSHALTINGIQIATVNVTGLLTCALSGNLVGNGPPVSGAIAVLSCGGANTNLAQAITNPAGVFTVILRILDTTIFDPSRCFIRVNLPVATCSVFPPNGALTSAIGLVTILQSAVGNVADFATGLFTYSVL